MNDPVENLRGYGGVCIRKCEPPFNSMALFTESYEVTIAFENARLTLFIETTARQW